MYKRDVEMIARIIKANSGNRPKLAKAFADELCQIVSAFDRIKFYKQCGVKVDRVNYRLKPNATPI